MLRRRTISLLVLLLFGLLLFLDSTYEMPSWPFAVLFLAFLGITVGGSFFIQWNYHLTSLHANEATQDRRISLTFDDGPHPQYTPKTLELLEKYDAKATFFCIGKAIEKHPEIFKQILDKGHSVGNHTYSHSKSFGFFGTVKVMEELQHTIDIVLQLTGKRLKLYRPAFGVTNPMIEKAVDRLHLKSIGWSVRSLDTTARDETAVLERITGKLSKGDIVLLHDTSQKTVDVLERLLLFLDENQLKSVTVDQLLNIEAYEI